MTTTCPRGENSSRENEGVEPVQPGPEGQTVKDTRTEVGDVPFDPEDGGRDHYRPPATEIPNQNQSPGATANGPLQIHKLTTTCLPAARDDIP